MQSCAERPAVEAKYDFSGASTRLFSYAVLDSEKMAGRERSCPRLVAGLGSESSFVTRHARTSWGKGEAAPPVLLRRLNTRHRWHTRPLHSRSGG